MTDEPPRNDPTPPDEDFVEEEEEAAAAEAAGIGGRVDEDGDDPAKWPLAESGEGESEGFELAEQELTENASHGDQHRFPDRDVPPAEEPEGTTYSEPDQETPQDE